MKYRVRVKNVVYGDGKKVITYIPQRRKWFMWVDFEYRDNQTALYLPLEFTTLEKALNAIDHYKIIFMRKKYYEFNKYIEVE